MGLYWAAVDNNRKEYFEPPPSYSNKTPGIYHPGNPFPAMVVMMNIYGGNFEIENDGNWECYYSKGYKEITEEVYKKLLDYQPAWKEFSKEGEVK